MSYAVSLAIRITTLALIALSSLTLMFAIMKQSGNTEGVSAIQGSTVSSSDSFYGKNRGRKLDQRLKRWTVISGIVLALSAIAYYLVDILATQG